MKSSYQSHFHTVVYNYINVLHMSTICSSRCSMTYLSLPDWAHRPMHWLRSTGLSSSLLFSCLFLQQKKSQTNTLCQQAAGKWNYDLTMSMISSYRISFSYRGIQLHQCSTLCIILVYVYRKHFSEWPMPDEQPPNLTFSMWSIIT